MTTIREYARYGKIPACPLPDTWLDTPTTLHEDELRLKQVTCKLLGIEVGHVALDRWARAALSASMNSRSYGEHHDILQDKKWLVRSSDGVTTAICSDGYVYRFETGTVGVADLLAL